MASVLGNGIYTFKEAARLTGLRRSRIREWFRRKPVFQGDYHPVDGDLAISFYDLVDVFVAGQLREHGVSMQTIRKVYARMESDLASRHPFCRRELMSDGRSVFLRNAGDDEPQIIEVITKQGVFSQFILPVLQTIDYDKVLLLAKRWRIADSVVLDPQICFGSPIIDLAGIPTSILARAYDANGKDAATVAQWYGVDESAVLAATEFESRFAA